MEVTQRDKDWLVRCMAAPVYIAFVFLGLIFQSHMFGSVLIFLAVGLFIDNILIVQAAGTLKERDGEVSRKAFRRAMLWRRGGLVAAVLGSIFAASI